MSRLPKWAVIIIGVVMFLLALMGITNSVHTMAKIVYALLIAISVAITVIGVRRRSPTESRS